jgi:hypothetical protein
VLSLAKHIASSLLHGVQASSIVSGSVPRLRTLNSTAWSHLPQMKPHRREWLLRLAQQAGAKHFV